MGVLVKGFQDNGCEVIDVNSSKDRRASGVQDSITVLFVLLLVSTPAFLSIPKSF
jgi:hypothetical protein